MAGADRLRSDAEEERGLREIAGSSDPWRLLPALARLFEREEPDYTRARALQRVLRLARARAQELGLAAPGERLKLAVLAGTTSSQLVWMLDLHLAASGLESEIYEAPYGAWAQELLDPSSGLYRFAPAVAVVSPGEGAVALPALDADADAVDAAVAAAVEGWRVLWARAGAAGIQLVQDNFVLPVLRPLGNGEAAIPASPGRFLALLNEALLAAAPGHVTIHDLDHVASCFGKRAFFDERFFLVSKQSCALEALPACASSLAGLVRAIRGRARKCLVLDLDNTLWGGVVADDGLEGLVLGQGSPEGEAFLRFQAYVRSLGERGVVLCVCSKNNEDDARAPFLRHPEMALKLEDLACFVANWSDKPTNLRAIAAELRLGLDSFVFVDDDPRERAFVRSELPEVAVPELPPDPAAYAETIDRHRYFEQAAFTPDDRQRSRRYREDRRRQLEVEESRSDLEGFLRGLGMVATIRPLDGVDLARATQLANKSNQYNLTTWRVTEAEMRGLGVDPGRVVRTVRLRDRVGDNGLVSVAIGREDGGALLIEMWLMSCRVIGRGVEQALLRHLWRVAQARGLKRLRGVYLPTAKNLLARDHYSRLGFSAAPPEPGDPPGAGRWELEIAGPPPDEPRHIREEE